MRPLLTGLFLLACLPLAGAAAPGAAPAPAGETAPPSFRSDARLQKKVTLAFKNAPLSEVLGAVGREVKARLSAGNTADEKVTLFVDERPAVDALTRIAQHLDYQWYRNETGYELAQNGAGKRREAALREAARARLIGAIRGRMESIERLAGSSPEKLDQREKELSARLAVPGLAADERARLQEEIGAIRDLLQPGAAAAAAVYRLLNPVQLQQVYAGGEMRLSTAENTLPAAVADQIHQSMNQSIRGIKVQSVFAESRVPGGGGAAGPPAVAPTQLPPTGAEAVVRLTDAPGLRPLGRVIPGSPLSFGPRSPGLRLEIVTTSIRGDGDRHVTLPMPWSPNLDNTSPRARVGTQTEDPELKREVELALPGKPMPGEGGAAPAKVRILDGGALPGLRPLSEVGEALHQATGLEVLSDSYIRARVSPGLVTGKRTVVQILDAIANELDYTWTKEGNLVLLRSNVYYDDRPAEVPQRILRSFRDAAAKANGATLDSLANLAAALADPQVKSMQDYWGWYLEGSGLEAGMGSPRVYDNRYHLRFWAGLGAAQKQAVLAGEILPVQKLGVPQRQAFLAALTARSDRSMGPGDRPLPQPPSAEELAGAGFSLKVNQLQQQAFSASGPDGDRVAVIARTAGPGGNAPVAPPQIAGQPDLQLQPRGKPTLLDEYNFSYHLAGNPAPARSTRIPVPRPPAGG